MRSRISTFPVLVIGVAGIIVGLAMPAAARETRHLINGNTIKPNTVTGKQIKESTLGTVPSARKAASVPRLKWHALPLGAGWSNDGASADRLASYAIDIQGLVHFKGEVHCATTCGVLFVLPKAAAPSVQLDLPIYTNENNVGEADVKTTGEVNVFDTHSATAGSAAYYSVLDGVVYATH
jgi:hypothetical protein